MDCTCYRCGAEFSRKDNLARHLRRKIPCMPTTPMESLATAAPLHAIDTLETRVDNLARCIETLSMKIDLLVDRGKPRTEAEGISPEEDATENEPGDKSGDESEPETIPAPTKHRARDLCTKAIAKHAQDLHKLADAGPRQRVHILADALPSLHRALGDVAHLVLEQKVGVPAEHIDETNEHIEDIREFADAPTHEKEQMLQTGSGFLSILAPILGAVAQPILHALGI